MSKTDATLRVITVAALFVWIVLYGSVFEAPYSEKLVELHALPLWRFGLALLVLFGAMWCPRVGIVAAIAVFLYLSDLEKLTIPFVPIEKA